MLFEFGDPTKLIHDVSTISCCAVASKRSILATGCQDGSIYIWELLRGEFVTKMVAPVDMAPKTYKAGPNGVGMTMVRESVSYDERRSQNEGVSEDVLFDGPETKRQGGDDEEVEDHLMRNRYNTLGTLGRPSSLVLHTPKKNMYTGLSNSRSLGGGGDSTSSPTRQSTTSNSNRGFRAKPTSSVTSQKLLESREWRDENPYYDPNVEDERYFHSRMMVNGLSFNHDASVLVSVGEDGSMYLWDMTAVHAAVLEFHQSAQEEDDVEEDIANMRQKRKPGAPLIPPQSHRKPKWNEHIPIKWRKLAGHDGSAITCVVFSPSSLLIATGSKDNDLILWGSMGRPVCGRLRCHTNWISCITFSSDSDYIASGSYDMTVCIWSSQAFQLIRVIRIHHYPIRCVGFSVENSVIAAGDGQGNLMLCRTTDGVCLRVLKGHFGAVTSVIFAESLGGIVTTSEDTSIKVWSLKGDCLHSFKAHEGSVLSAALSLFDEVVITTSEDYEVRVWPVTLVDKTFS